MAGINFDALLGPAGEYERSDPKSGDFPEDEDEPEELDSMMGSYGEMTLSAEGSLSREFFGAGSGLAFIKRTKDLLDGPNVQHSLFEPAGSPPVQLFDAPLPPRQAYRLDASIFQLMPPRPTVQRLLHVVFTQVYPLFNFLNEEEFMKCTDRIYETDAIEYTDADRSFLPLFYAVSGLGYLFSRSEHNKHGCQEAMNQA